MTQTDTAIVTRLEHVHLSVSNLDASVAFYRDVLGFSLRWRRPAGKDLSPCAHVGTAGFYVAMSERPGALRSRRETAQIFHFGFVTTEAREAVLARIESLGVEVSEASDRKEGWGLYIFDPDGHEIELVGYAEGYEYA